MLSAILILAASIGLSIVLIFGLGTTIGIVLAVIFSIMFLVGWIGAILALARRCRTD
ncbi:MAG TPA: hypothetical protein PLF33_05665 [Bacilli bacterium]|nr:hypothetical protein [Bacilli bacterium]HPD12955.1 hypothetical protein [Bacilli bacterium]HPK58874.1 hypothetical protein [Bacilli bacterium]HRS30781.1 hypothetical protein [Bacilli bacterium]HRU49551.1 hypothetical protein [Bacilli bacterium]